MNSAEDLPGQQIPTSRVSGGSFLILILGLVVLIGVIACAGSFLLLGFRVSASSVVQLDSGRMIQVTSDSGSVGVSSTTDSATFDLGASTISVTPDSVMMDGSKIADLDPDATEIQITYSSGQATVVAESVIVDKSP